MLEPRSRRLCDAEAAVADFQALWAPTGSVLRLEIGSLLGFYQGAPEGYDKDA